MAPSTAQVSAQLRQLIFYHLDNDLYQNALFLAGRLQGLDPRNADTIHILSLCHYRLGQYKAAYDHTKAFAHRGTHLGCSYIFAQACMAIEKYIEGSAALERARPVWERRNQWNRHSETARRHLPDAAAVYCLMGKLLHANNDLQRAVEYYVEALKLNPFMWDAYERLCDTGAKINVSNIFKSNTEMLSHLSLNENAQSLQDTQVINPQPNHVAPNTVSISFPETKFTHEDPFNAMASDQPAFGTDSSRKSQKIPNASGFEPAEGMDTPPYRVQPTELGVSGVHMEPPNAPARRVRTAQTFGMGSDSKLRVRDRFHQSSEGGEQFEIHRPTSVAPTHKRTVSGHASQATLPSQSDQANAQLQQRKSERILNRIRPANARNISSNATIGTRDGRELKKARATGTKGRALTNTSTVGRVVSGNRKPLEGVDRSAKARLLLASSEAEGGQQKHTASSLDRGIEALEWLLDLLSKLGRGYHALSNYQCQEALQIFNNIQPQQRETPWVLSKIGRALFEQTSYAEAEKVFSRLKSLAPSRLEDMEIYSTVLWHLKHDTELAFLSYELVDADRKSPQAWCTIGNSFSLQRSHDQAIKCFKRATQLDPKFAYGYTLQGHEHIANEEYDKALTSYREAINADRRHYNGWYGLGHVYEKMGRYDLAEKHFRAAADINPSNHLLMVCIGAAQDRLRKPLLALASFERACTLAPHSVNPRFKRARVLTSLQRHAEALEELNLLKDMVPDEASVHFMLGKLHKSMGDKPSAVKHLTIALNLDPKAAPYIKEAMETMDDQDNDYEDDDDPMF